MEALELLAPWGLGGVLGAVATLWLVQSRWKLAGAEFRAAFSSYVEGRNDPETVALKESFLSALAETERLQKALDQLRRSLRRRK